MTTDLEAGPAQEPGAEQAPDGRRPGLLTARPLMMCVVLGAFAILIIVVTRTMSLAIGVALPWLSYPVPLPWYMPVIMAPLLVRRQGAALVTGLLAAVAGGMALLAALVIELAALPWRKTWRIGTAWAMMTGVLVGALRRAGVGRSC